MNWPPIGRRFKFATVVGLVALIAAGVAASGVARAGRSARAACATSLTVTPAPGTTISGMVGERLKAVFTVSGGSGFYFWQVATVFPPGLESSLPATGATRETGSPTVTLFGTPSSIGIWSLGFNLYDWPEYPNGTNCPAGASVSYTIRIKSVGSVILEALDLARSALRDIEAHPVRASAAKQKIRASRNLFKPLAYEGDDKAREILTFHLSLAADTEYNAYEEVAAGKYARADISLDVAISQLEAALKAPR